MESISRDFHQTGVEPQSFAFTVHRSTNWAIRGMSTMILLIYLTLKGKRMDGKPNDWKNNNNNNNER